MPIKKVDRLEEGDILASGITGNQGVVLVKAGAAVTASHVKLFKQWGILTVQVAESHGPGGAAPKVQPEHLERAASQLRARFGDSLAGEVMSEVFEVAVNMRAEQLAAEEFHEYSKR